VTANKTMTFMSLLHVR